MDINPAFTSPLAPVMSRYLALKTALGRGYATERQFLRALDTFLVADTAADLTPEVFERWCQTQAHLKSGIRRAQMRLVRNLCLYRRRTEPACFVPDRAGFPPRHQHAPPYILTDTPPALRPSPLLGEHNRYVFGELFGMGDTEIEQLVKDGVIE